MDELLQLLSCPFCHAHLVVHPAATECLECGQRFAFDEGVPSFVRGVSQDADDQKHRQVEFFGRETSSGFEIERPYGQPRLYRWLLEEKFRRSVCTLRPGMQGATALTVCGGSGMDAEFLARAGARVISSDISPGAARRAQERARQHGMRILSIVADVERLPFADRSIDIVYVHDGLHHLVDPFVGLAEMTRVARVAVAITEPAQAVVTRIAIRLGLALESEEAGNVVARLDPSRVVAVLGRDGFRVLRVERYGMFYRHEPGWAMRVFSSPGLFGLARGGIFLGNLLARQFGNKLAVQAQRGAGKVGF